MTNDGKIYITISDKRFGKNVAETDEQNKLDKQNKENVLGKFVQHKFFNLIESQAKQAVSYTISNIGNFTGDYVKQTQISETVQFINEMLDLGLSFASGTIATGSPIGGAVALAVATTGKVFTYGEQIYAGQVQNARINRDIKQLRTRAGLNSTNNGNRGTEY